VARYSKRTVALLFIHSEVDTVRDIPFDVMERERDIFSKGVFLVRSTSPLLHTDMITNTLRGPA
jgi:hypothetical protein